MGSRVRIEFGSEAELRQQFEATLSHGGASAPPIVGLGPGDTVDITLIHPVNRARLGLRTRIVLVKPDGGMGLAIVDFSPELRAEIAAWIDTHARRSTERAGANADRAGATLHQRLRNLSVPEQMKIARTGDQQERVTIERIYGKHVWEPLLQNPKITPPEVMRIARMPQIPRPLLEVIVANPAWMASAHVRRALLGNRRLAHDLAIKVLRATPKPELKLVTKQSAYPPRVRGAAKRLLGI